ncbi:MAG TPA: TIGR03435 family protein [Bryobacteraceae bacterium]|jgi:uncharacterized protein (TIGR03435 family)
MRIDRRASLLAFGLLAVVRMPAQTPESHPTFEVAAIKPNSSGDRHSGTDGWQGRIVFTNLTLQALIAQAYRVSPFQVTGPDWLATERFDIEAKYPEKAKPGDRQQMLRSLLEDRFKLAAHHESKELPGYALIVAKTGFKLTRSEGGDNDTQHSGGRIQRLTAKSTTIASLAILLSRYIGQPVVDKTGISGAYDFELSWSRDEQATDPDTQDAVPSIFTALQETLGLRLRAQKVAAEIVVVDHAERRPTEN